MDPSRAPESTRPTIHHERMWVDPSYRWPIGEATQRWLNARHGWSPLTSARYERALARWVDWLGGPDVHLDTIRPIDFRTWVDELQPARPGATYKASTVNTITQPVRAFHGWAVRMQMATGDPTAETSPTKVPRRPPKRLPRDAVRRLLAAADVQERVQITLFVTYGLRLAELTRLRVEDWDRERDLLTILGKGNKVRVLPLYGEALAELTGWVDFVLRRPAGPLWPSPDDRDRPLTARWIARRLTMLGQECGMHVHPHALRHTALSDMVEEGMDLETVRSIAGHETLATLSIYTSAAPEHVRRSLERRRRPYWPTPPPG